MVLRVCQLSAGEDRELETQLSLEEWLQLEAEAWDSSDEDDNPEEVQHSPDDVPAEASASRPSDGAPQGASSIGSSSGSSGSETSWAAGLPFKVKPGEQRWDGEVPPDVVVLAPPQRDADGNLLLPPGLLEATDSQPAATDKQPAAAPRKLQQQGAPAQEDKPQQQQQQRRKQQPQQQQQQRVRRGGEGAAGGRRKGGGRGGARKGAANAPAWMRSLPPSQ